MGSDCPIGGRDYPRTYQEVRSWFADDVACIDYLGRLRWPDGFVCPKCGCDRSWRTGKRQWVCAQCAQRTSAMAGTIFHRTRTPISTWFAAAWFVTSQKNGVSAVGLQHALGFGSYETAWAWIHKLRRAMVRPERDLLAGQVELDQIFLEASLAAGPGVALADAHALVDELLAVDFTGGADAALLDSLREVERLSRRLAAVGHGLIAEASARSLPDSRGASSMAALVRQVLRLHPCEAAARVRAAEAAGPRRALTGEPLEPVFADVAAAKARG